MLIAEPNHSNASFGTVRKGRTTANERTTGSSSVTPAVLSGFQAADPRYAMLRLPIINSAAAPLIDKETWKGVTTKATPTRSTLLNLFKIQHLTGQLTSDRAHWLADNKQAPLLLWNAAESSIQITAKNANLTESFVKTYIDAFPIKAVTRFVLDWSKEAPHAVHPDLTGHLLSIKQYSTKETSQFPDIDGYEKALNATLVGIADHLNGLITQPTPHHTRGDASTIAAFPTYSTQGPITFASTEMIGIPLDKNLAETPEPTWAAIKQCLALICKYLQPLVDAGDISGMMLDMDLDEAHDDLEAIRSYLLDNNLDENAPDSIRQALEALDGQMLLIEDEGAWEHFTTVESENMETTLRWQNDHTTTTFDTLAIAAENLSAPVDNIDAQAQAWIQKTLATLNNVMANHQVEDYETLLPDLMDANAFENQPVFFEHEHHVADQLQMMFEGAMGGEPYEYSPTSWYDSARSLTEQAMRLGYGNSLLSDLATISNEKNDDND